MAIIGYGWALLGLANIIGVFINMGGDPNKTGIAAFGLVINMVLFVLPGMAIGFMGTKRKAS